MTKTTLGKRTLVMTAVAVVIAALVVSGQRRGSSQTAVELQGLSGLSVHDLGPVLDALEATDEQRAQLQTLIDDVVALHATLTPKQREAIDGRWEQNAYHHRVSRGGLGWRWLHAGRQDR